MKESRVFDVGEVAGMRAVLPPHTYWTEHQESTFWTLYIYE